MTMSKPTRFCVHGHPVQPNYANACCDEPAPDTQRCIDHQPHDYQYIRTTQDHIEGGYQSLWRRIDHYTCRKCLAARDLTTDEYSRGTPAWWGR